MKYLLSLAFAGMFAFAANAQSAIPNNDARFVNPAVIRLNPNKVTTTQSGLNNVFGTITLADNSTLQWRIYYKDGKATLLTLDHSGSASEKAFKERFRNVQPDALFWQHCAGCLQKGETANQAPCIQERLAQLFK